MCLLGVTFIDGIGALLNFFQRLLVDHLFADFGLRMVFVSISRSFQKNKEMSSVNIRGFLINTKRSLVVIILNHKSSCMDFLQVKK